MPTLNVQKLHTASSLHVSKITVAGNSRCEEGDIMKKRVVVFISVFLMIFTLGCPLLLLADMPQTSYRLNVVLVLDNSGSMRNNPPHWMGNDPDRRSVDAARLFIDLVEPNTNIGVVLISTHNHTDENTVIPMRNISSSVDREQLKNEVDRRVTFTNFTDIGAALVRAERMLLAQQAQDDEMRRNLIVLFTDGQINTMSGDMRYYENARSERDTRRVAVDARANNIHVYSIGLRLAGVECADAEQYEELIQYIGQSGHGQVIDDMYEIKEIFLNIFQEYTGAFSHAIRKTMADNATSESVSFTIRYPDLSTIIVVAVTDDIGQVPTISITNAIGRPAYNIFAPDHLHTGDGRFYSIIRAARPTRGEYYLVMERESVDSEVSYWIIEIPLFQLRVRAEERQVIRGTNANIEIHFFDTAINEPIHFAAIHNPYDEIILTVTDNNSNSKTVTFNPTNVLGTSYILSFAIPEIFENSYFLRFVAAFNGMTSNEVEIVLITPEPTPSPTPTPSQPPTPTPIPTPPPTPLPTPPEPEQPTPSDSLCWLWFLIIALLLILFIVFIIMRGKIPVKSTLPVGQIKKKRRIIKMKLSKMVKWSSDAPNIVDVDENGTQKSISVGTATITTKIMGITVRTEVITVPEADVSIRIVYGRKQQYHGDANSNCPEFRRLLYEIFRDNKRFMDLAQEILGYCLFCCGEKNYCYENDRPQKVFMFTGVDVDGKNLLCDIIDELMQVEKFPPNKVADSLTQYGFNDMIERYCQGYNSLIFNVHSLSALPNDIANKGIAVIIPFDNSVGGVRLPTAKKLLGEMLEISRFAYDGYIRLRENDWVFTKI
jgi:uncharacterized protein YegL